VAVAAAVVAAGMVDRDPVALADAMTLVNAVIAGPVLAAVVPSHSSPRSRAEGDGCSAANEVQQHEARSSRQGAEATLERASVSSDRRIDEPRCARRCRRTDARNAARGPWARAKISTEKEFCSLVQKSAFCAG
jgi:hypothetical protein